MPKTSVHWFRKAVWLTASFATLLASLSALSAWVSPVWCRWLGVFTLGYPVLMLSAFLLVVFNLLVWRKRLWLPLLLWLPGLYALGTYAPYNFSQSATSKDTLRVMTYNVFFWSWQERDGNGLSPMARYIANRRPDIVFVQEAYSDPSFEKKAMRPLFQKVGLNHYVTIQMENDQVGILTRYPILDYGRIEMPSKNNGATWFRLLRAKGDTLLAVSVHLQSVGLSEHDREGYSDLTRGREEGGLTNTQRMSRRILSRLANASAVRAVQAKKLHDFLVAHRGERIILAGDFNDTPISFPHHMVDRELTDAFRTAGRGLSRTFNRHSMVVRIDHLFCSSHFMPYRAKVDDQVAFSDHYPLIVDLAVKAP